VSRDISFFEIRLQEAAASVELFTFTSTNVRHRLAFSPSFLPVRGRLGSVGGRLPINDDQIEQKVIDME